MSSLLKNRRFVNGIVLYNYEYLIVFSYFYGKWILYGVLFVLYDEYGSSAVECE